MSDIPPDIVELRLDTKKEILAEAYFIFLLFNLKQGQRVYFLWLEGYTPNPFVKISAAYLLTFTVFWSILFLDVLDTFLIAPVFLSLPPFCTCKLLLALYLRGRG